MLTNEKLRVYDNHYCSKEAAQYVYNQEHSLIYFLFILNLF